jgi:hypothetical protein
VEQVLDEQLSHRHELLLKPPEVLAHTSTAFFIPGVRCLQTWTLIFFVFFMEAVSAHARTNFKPNLCPLDE